MERPPFAPVVGDMLPSLDVPISRSDVVTMAIATRDFHPVHHDIDTARSLGHPGLFVNIMTTCGLVERFVRNWCGDIGQLGSLKLKLGVPHYAGETLTLRGEVTAIGTADASSWAEVSFSGSNARGRHAGGVVRICWTG